MVQNNPVFSFPATFPPTKLQEKTGPKNLYTFCENFCSTTTQNFLRLVLSPTSLLSILQMVTTTTLPVSGAKFFSQISSRDLVLPMTEGRKLGRGELAGA